MDALSQIAAKLQEGEEEAVADLTRAALDAGLGPKQILDEGLIAGMQIIGEQFRKHEIFLPEVLLAARAMTAGMELLKPLLISQEVPARGKVVLGSIQGDLHDIGKNLVGIMLRGAGFEVIDLGIDVTPQRFVDTAEAEGARVIGVSALLTTTMSRMGKVVELRDQRGLGGRVEVIVGGAPVSKEFARSIGASAYCFDAANAVETVVGLTSGG